MIAGDGVAGSFADAPVGVDELRAGRSNLASDISVRSTLVEVLRSLDRGEIAPEALVVIYTPNAAGKHDVGYRVSSKNPIVTLGMLARALVDLQS